MLTHFLINPKISSTTILCSKFVSNNGIRKITCNLFRITMELKLRSHLTRSHNITSISLRITLRNSRSTKCPIFTYSQVVSVNIGIRIRISNLKSIQETTVSTRTKVFHNTNLTIAVRSNQTILLDKPVSSKLNIKHSTTLTRSLVTISVKPKNVIIKLSTSHSLPSPLNSIDVYNTDCSLTFSQECKRESIVVITISIGQNVIDFRSFGNS